MKFHSDWYDFGGGVSVEKLTFAPPTIRQLRNIVLNNNTMAAVIEKVALDAELTTEQTHLAMILALAGENDKLRSELRGKSLERIEPLISDRTVEKKEVKTVKII